MEIVVEASGLIPALKRAHGVTRKSTNPALESVLLQASGERLTVTAFDWEVAVTSEVPARVHKPGRALLSKESFEYVSALRGPLTIRLRPNRHVSVEVGRSTANFVQLGSCDDFPKVPEPQVQLAPLNADGLLDMLRRVPHASATDNSRPAMSGVYLHPTGGDKHAMVATDGVRIATLPRQLGGVHLPQGGVVLPATAVVKMRQLLEEEGAPEGWGFGASPGFVALRRAGLTLLSRLVDSPFPDYARVTSLERTTLPVPREELLASLDRVATAGKEVGLVLEESGQLRFEARNEKNGNEGADTLEVKRQRTTPRRAWFKYGHLRDALANSVGDEIFISLPPKENTNGVPAFVLTSEEDGYLAGVMPLSRRGDEANHSPPEAPGA